MSAERKLKSTPGFFSWDRLTVVLILSQIFVKFAVEFPKIGELRDPGLPLEQTAWIMTAFWLMLVPLCVQKHRASFLAAALWGLVHFALGILPPIVGACNHWVAGSLVSLQGLAIAIASFASYKKLSSAQAIPSISQRIS